MCEDLVYKYFAIIKQIFTSMISNDEFPNIGWLQFSEFTAQTKMVDKNCSINKIDTAFIATNYEIEDLDDNPQRELCRYEFFEILVRIADIKYR